MGLFSNLFSKQACSLCNTEVGALNRTKLKDGLYICKTCKKDTSAFFKAENYTAKLTDVISVVVPDKPNGLNELLKILSDNNIEIDYLYVFIGKNNLGAQAILKASNVKEVETILLNNYY